MINEPSFYRGRRLRRNHGLRELVRENEIRPQDLIQPYFVIEHEDPNYEAKIPSMPGQKQLGLQALVDHLSQALPLGLRGIILFGIPKDKDERATQAYAKDGIIQRAIKRIKDALPDLIVVTDVCLCEYMSHGHCGIVENGRVLNDPSLELLSLTALSHVQAGADMVAPSDMMDGRVRAIRQALDENGFVETPLMSYSVKYASSFYGPFRDAAQSAPEFGDRKTYQMDPANAWEAFREVQADIEEGADICMVKPALPYLDILAALRREVSCPLAAYHVSGEYSLIKAAAEKGWVDEQAIILESLLSIKRAGADLIISYFTEQVLEFLRN